MNTISQKELHEYAYAAGQSAFAWDVRGHARPRQAAELIRDLAAFLPLYVPEEGVLMLDWELVGDGGSWRAQPRLDFHCQPWLALPASAIRPTGAVLVAAEDAEGERLLTLEMPGGRAHRARVLTLASGLLRMSMQAHDAKARFLPVLLRSDLAQDAAGNPVLHLHRLGSADLEAWIPEPTVHRQLVRGLAERVLALMSIPGGGREQPLLVADENL